MSFPNVPVIITILILILCYIICENMFRTFFKLLNQPYTFTTIQGLHKAVIIGVIGNICYLIAMAIGSIYSISLYGNRDSTSPIVPFAILTFMILDIISGPRHILQIHNKLRLLKPRM